MDSVWKSVPRVKFDSLKKDTSTDVLIVGGGIVGILCANKLKNAGADCLVIEAERILSGVTGNTTAKITFGHGLIYDKLIKNYGEKSAKLYLDAQICAEKEYEALCRNIECDYEVKDAYVYSVDNRKKIEKEIFALKKLGVKAEFSEAPDLPIRVAGAVRLRSQMQIHPLKFLYAISKDFPIMENTKAVEFYPYKIMTNHGRINFKKLIVATHFPIYNKHGAYFIKLYQHRSYVIALKGAPDVGGMYVDESDTGLSFRNYGDLLLLGGGGHRTGKKGGCWRELEEFATKHFGEAKIVGRWATQDCMTLDGIPYIGQYSPSTPDVYVATGFNKWGMTSSMVAANILCDAVMKKENMYADIFSPSRSILHPQLAVNALESIKSLFQFGAPRCPHLGCALKYNRVEHSWDCPCHGSRFTESGKLIDNPATDDHNSIGEKNEKFK